jgi:hypothetical protein
MLDTAVRSLKKGKARMQHPFFGITRVNLSASIRRIILRDIHGASILYNAWQAQMKRTGDMQIELAAGSDCYRSPAYWTAIASESRQTAGYHWVMPR